MLRSVKFVSVVSAPAFARAAARARSLVTRRCGKDGCTDLATTGGFCFDHGG